MPADSLEPDGAFPIWVPIQVRFGDTDALGHLNNAVYLTYLEVARVAYIEAVTGRPVGANPVAPSFVLAEARITYRNPVRLGEAVAVACRVGWLGRTSFSMEYRVEATSPAHAPVRRLQVASPTGGPGDHVEAASPVDGPRGRAGAAEAGRLAALAETVQVMVDPGTGAPLPISGELRRLVEAYEGRALPARPPAP